MANDGPVVPNAAGLTTKQRFGILTCLFLLNILILYMSFGLLPDMSPQHREDLKFPRNIEDVKRLKHISSFYMEEAYFRLIIIYFTLYVFLQTFAIPGSMFLSVLSGALFSFPVAFSVVTAACTVGASLCYLISYCVTRDLVQFYFPAKLARLRRLVDAHRSNMLNYIMFLRVTPLVPNWFVNLASPVVGIKYSYFAIATCFGIMPASFLAINAGATVSTMTDGDSIIGVRQMATLVGIGALALVPTYFKGAAGDDVEDENGDDGKAR